MTVTVPPAVGMTTVSAASGGTEEVEELDELEEDPPDGVVVMLVFVNVVVVDSVGGSVMVGPGNGAPMLSGGLASRLIRLSAALTICHVMVVVSATTTNQAPTMPQRLIILRLCQNHRCWILKASSRFG